MPPASLSKRLRLMYESLLAAFGPQGWWPSKTPFETCVGAILTQNTAWKNVSKAVANLESDGLMEFASLRAAPDSTIARLIRPAGYFNLKTRRLRAFLDFVTREYGDFEAFLESRSKRLREELLSVTGIGPETADSMLLYALNRPVFVVDAYTKRVLLRHGLCGAEDDYHRLQEFFSTHLVEDAGLYNEFHALIVRLGSTLCRRTGPDCEICPLKDFNGGPVVE